MGALARSLSLTLCSLHPFCGPTFLHVYIYIDLLSSLAFLSPLAQKDRLVLVVTCYAIEKGGG